MPAVDRLAAAFRSTAGLVATDAQLLARDAYGILVKSLSLEDADGLRTALAAQGVETEVVAEENLPELAPAQRIRRADCLPESLTVYDPLGRAVPVEWGQLMAIAAGVVRMIESKQGRTRRVLLGSFSTIGSEWTEAEYTNVVTETKFKEERNLRLVLELVLVGGQRRYSINAEQFAFDYLADRRTNDLGANFVNLVRDLAGYAPQALLNRGGLRLLAEPPQAFSYPSRNAFQEEIIWLLWQAGRGLAPAAL
jgi:hypothetical protein